MKQVKSTEVQEYKGRNKMKRFKSSTEPVVEVSPFEKRYGELLSKAGGSEKHNLEIIRKRYDKDMESIGNIALSELEGFASANNLP